MTTGSLFGGRARRHGALSQHLGKPIVVIDGPMADGLLGGWEVWMRAAGLSPRTIEDRIQLVARFEQTAGSSLTVGWEAIAEFVSNPAYSAGTRQTYFAHLRAWFK